MRLSLRMRSCARFANRTAMRANRAPNGREGRGASSSSSTLVLDTRKMRTRSGECRIAAMQWTQLSTENTSKQAPLAPRRRRRIPSRRRPERVHGGRSAMLKIADDRGSDGAGRDDPPQSCAASQERDYDDRACRPADGSRVGRPISGAGSLRRSDDRNGEARFSGSQTDRTRVATVGTPSRDYALTIRLEMQAILVVRQPND